MTSKLTVLSLPSSVSLVPKSKRKTRLTTSQLVFVSATIFSFLIILTINRLRRQPFSPPVQRDDSNDKGYVVNFERNCTSSIRDRPNDELLSLDEINFLKKEFNKRRKRVESICCSIAEKQKFKLNESFLSNMIIDLKHKISWCPIYKVASSTWMKNFAVLGDSLPGPVMDLIRRNVIEIKTVARRAFPYLKSNVIHEKFNQTRKFMIVRHPMERLVSAYRDKLESKAGREYYYERFGRHIARKYGKSMVRNESDIMNEPTFAEFLEFIVKERRFDEHWKPFYEACHPCTVKYDYILKLETFDVDQKFLIQDTGLSEYLYDEKNFRNMNPHGCTSKSLVNEYVRRVPRSILEEISKIYEKDFKLFSYTLDYLD